MLALLFGACGPESSSSSRSSLARTTQTIATDYQASRDLTAARAQLQALDVANVNQWLVYTTESAIVDSETAEITRALVALTLDLGLQSNAIDGYAAQNGFSNTVTGSDSVAAPIIAVPAVNNAAGAVDSAPIENNVTTALVPVPNASDSDSNSAVADGQSASENENSTLESVGDVADTPTPVPTTAPTATPDAQPVVLALTGINIRSGPGVDYEIAGALAANERTQIAGKNPGGDWWEIIMPNGRQGWVYGALVETAGNTDEVAVAANIPTPPPTAIPVPTVPSVPPPAEPVPAPTGPDFRVVEKRLWDVVENGGRLDGPSVTCGEKRQLIVNVIDAAGNRLNGAAIQEIYGAQEIFVTGTQGKGDGAVEYVLGGGQAVKVIRDVDGREVSSEEAHGLSTKPWEIPFETLIGGRFCADAASCQSFVDATGCYGHYSWTVIFQRNY